MNVLSFMQIMSSCEFVSASVKGNFEDFELESEKEEQRAKRRSRLPKKKS